MRLRMIFAPLLILACVLLTSSHAWADDRADARMHYQAGLKAYSSADYKVAIREFSAAQQLLPADLNNYNLALCYDKLGDAEPAMQYYRSYLDKVPNTDKRAEIEASVSRLEAAAKSASAKKADEARKADDLRKADEARQAEELRKAQESAERDAEAKQRAEEARKLREQPSGAEPPMGAPSVGTPAAPTGDRQLDRVQQIDINSIRDQRMGPMPPTTRPGNPAAAPQNLNNGAQLDPNTGLPAATASANPTAPPPPNGALPPTDASVAKHEDPLYKKWWFWAVVAVSAYVVYEIATDNSSSTTNARTARELPLNSPGHSVPDAGWTLFHF